MTADLGQDAPFGELARPLSITVAHNGTTTTVDVIGEWDLASQAEARAALRVALEHSPERVVLDLSRLSFIDSSGMHNVIELYSRCEQQAMQLVIIPGPKSVQRPFEICQLTNRLPFLQTAA
jgi:anti-anti-sigma factor